MRWYDRVSGCYAWKVKLARLFGACYHISILIEETGSSMKHVRFTSANSFAFNVAAKSP